MRKWENLLLLICIGLGLDVFITRQARLHLATRPSCYQAFIVVQWRRDTILSPSSISVLSLALLLNALCNILIKKFLQALLPFAGCWLIMRFHCARLNSTQLDLVRWRIKAKEGTKGLSVPCDRLTIVNNNSSSSST